MREVDRPQTASPSALDPDSPAAAAIDRRLGRLADLMDVGVVVLGKGRDVELVNAQAARLLEVPLEDEEGWRQLAMALVESVDAAWSRRQSGTTFDLLWETCSPPRWLTFQIFFLDDEDRDSSPGVVLLARDRSLVSSLETDLAVAAQLRNLSQMYVGLAHDLRSPLNSLGLNLELLKRALAEGDEADELRQRRVGYCETIEHELERLGEGLDSLLSQTVVPESETTTFELGELVDELARLVRPQAGQQRVEVRVGAAPEPLAVEGHRGRLKQALLNLVINALEATPEEGFIELAVRRAGRRAVVSLRDSGPGIADEAVERIFDMHFTTKQTGTGIGLFVARKAIEADGGGLRLAATGPAGTEFVAELPLAGPA